MTVESSPPPFRIGRTAVFYALILGGAAALGFGNYLLFHAAVEVFAATVAFGIFAIAWYSTRRDSGEGYLLWLGCAYLPVAVLDLLHAFAYKGMGIFPGEGANLPTQLWIAGRYVQAAALATAPFFVRRPMRGGYLLAGNLALLALLAASIFVWRIFPDCFLEPGGLTPFKIASEYVICALLAVAILGHRAQRARFHPKVFALLAASIAVTIASELSFTLYVSVFGSANFAGHLLKLLAVLLLNHAFILSAIREPVDLLYRGLSESREALRAERDRLQAALDEVQALRGLLPICCHCKKIRNDTGYWEQLEKYVGDRTGASFSHGICPECLLVHYPEYAGSILDKGKAKP